MYIEYITPQLPSNRTYLGWGKSKRKGGTFRPTWLIRASDWQKVPGSEAKDGYCALSYCWEQSGEIVLTENGESICVDEPHHQIKHQMVFPPLDYFRPKEPKIRTTEHVKFEGVLQRICKDFKIDYLWYDKVCIDQTNKEEKHREIKQMHLIYSNTRFTVVLIPEIPYTDYKDTIPWPLNRVTSRAEDETYTHLLNSLWFRRSWTLEELMMSTDIVVVGKNTFTWYLKTPEEGGTMKQCDYMTTHLLGYKQQKVRSASQVLCRAHFRVSTKEHDKVFALANILADVVPIHIDYGMEISTVVRTFYRQLGERDRSVMCFGYSRVPSTMISHNLPSWTGVYGTHSPYPVPDVALDQNNHYHIDDNLHLHVTCRFHTIRISKYDVWYNSLDEKQQRRIRVRNYEDIESPEDFGGSENVLQLWNQWRMHAFAGIASTHQWKPDHPAFMSSVLTLSLTEDCEECIIPAMIFDVASYDTYQVDKLGLKSAVGYDHSYVFPVLRKSTSTELYKVIGCMLLKIYRREETREAPLERLDSIFTPLCTEPKEFIIE